MAKYEEHHEQVIKAHTGGEAIYSEATFLRIWEDAIFFRRKAAEENIDVSERKRYSRIIILLIAFYLESLSNLLCDVVLGKNWRIPKENKEEGVAETIIKFKAVYNELKHHSKELDTDGIQDIFNIRSKIMAHPPGRARLRMGKIGWNRIDKQFSYKKFSDFPLVYSHFSLQEADSVLAEVRDFRINFYNLLNDRKDRVPEDLLYAFYPQDLIEWSKEAPEN